MLYKFSEASRSLEQSFTLARKCEHWTIHHLFMLAWPWVKSEVACHNVCFLGWGSVSLKKRGDRASFIKNMKSSQEMRYWSNNNRQIHLVDKHTTTSKDPTPFSGQATVHSLQILGRWSMERSLPGMVDGINDTASSRSPFAHLLHAPASMPIKLKVRGELGGW
jgi:hypothetical protein